jgi:histidine ammonia-lyase
MRPSKRPEIADGPVVLTGSDLTIDALVRVARGGDPVELSPGARANIRASEALLQDLVRGGRRLYGLTTGVGALESIEVTEEMNREQQRRLLLSHAAGVGAPMREDQVRAMMLTRANVLALGISGARLETCEALLALLNRGVTPEVPERGSVGASDLAPLAHVGLALIGIGRARVLGEVMPAKDALAAVGLRPHALLGRDAFALINGLNQTIAVGALALADARRLVSLAEAATALSTAAVRAPADFLDPRVARAKGHEGQEASAARMRALMRAPDLKSASNARHRTGLSMRYAPQVLGACRSALAFAEQAIGTEMNAAIDNPMIFPDGWSTNNSGITSGQELAQALDLVANAIASSAVIAERRIAALLDPDTNGGLPPFLRTEAPTSSGLMIAQYTAASLVAELRTRSVPASLQSIPTCANTEDHVSMSALSARHLAWAIETAEIIVAIELLVGCRAIDLAGVFVPPRLQRLHATVRSAVPSIDDERIIADDIQAIVDRLRSDRLSS